MTQHAFQHMEREQCGDDLAQEDGKGKDKQRKKDESN